MIKHNVHTKRLRAECINETGKHPIGSKWIDISKRDTSSAD